MSKPRPERFEPRGRGRPAVPEGLRRRHGVRVHLRADELEQVRSAARGEDESVSEWIRGAIRACLGLPG